MAKKMKAEEVIETEVKEVEELTEVPEEEVAPTEEVKEEPKKKSLGKTLLIVAGVLGGVAIAALGMFGIKKASDYPGLYGYDLDDPCAGCTEDCHNCPHCAEDDEADSDDSSEEETSDE